MRREPMQVLPHSVASYERLRTQVTPTTNDDGPPRSVGVTEEIALRRREQLSHPESTTADALVKTSTVDGQKDFNVTVKPVVRDVKLCQRNSVVLSTARRQRSIRSWRSTESIEGLIMCATSPEGGGAAPATRSSFADPLTTVVTSSSSSVVCRSVYIDLGEYQTLLKHGRQEAVYSLPQPHCFGDDTLKAVKLITDKYDTFKRRQMRAMSFRDAAGASRQQSLADSDTIAEGLFCVCFCFPLTESLYRVHS